MTDLTDLIARVEAVRERLLQYAVSRATVLEAALALKEAALALRAVQATKQETT